MRNKLRIHVSGAGCVFLAVALLILPLKWLAAAMCACVIHELSQGMTLKAGTMIATGTPSGVGMGMDPQVWLQSGDVVRCEIDGIGVLENTVK